MQVATRQQLQQAVEEQIRVVAATDHALRRAELAVAQARTPAAADHAHHRADTALIAVEDAESELARLKHLLATATRTGRVGGGRGTGQRRLLDQVPLFDVG